MSIFLTVRGNLGQSFSIKQIDRDNKETSVVLNFSIASTRYKRQKVESTDQYVPAGPTEWLECEYWNRQAEHLKELLVKGMPVVVEGEEIIEFYENKEGQSVKARKIRVENIYLNLNSDRIESITLKPARVRVSDDDDKDIDEDTVGSNYVYANVGTDEGPGRE